MAEATQKDAEKRPLPGSPEARESGRRNLNSQIAQRQKMLLAGIGAIALIGGGMFIFGGDGDEGGSDANGAATIDTGGLVNRNLSQREFVASYGNRLDAQGRAIKDLQDTQLPRPEIEQELEALRAENARLLAWKEEAQKLQAKLARYEALLNVQIDPAINYASGRVVSDSGGPFVDTVLVNVGAEKGAKSGQAVVDTDGIIGRLVSTGPKASRVLLLTDLNSRVPVVIEPAHYKAVLAGDNTKWPKLEYLASQSAISPGDRVVTSGDGGLIPPGLPVGLVIQTSSGELRVQTFSDRGRLDFVRVLQYEFPSKVKRQDPPEVLDGPAEGEGAETGEAAPAAPAAQAARE